MRHFSSLFAVAALSALCCAIVACGPKKKTQEEVDAIITEMESAIKEFADETRAFEKAFMDIGRTLRPHQHARDHPRIHDDLAENERRSNR